MIAAVFLVGIPLTGVVFRQKVAVSDYELSYGYVIFMEKTMLSVLGFFPPLLTLHGYYHLAAGDCMMLCPKWNERKQFFLNFMISVLVLLVVMCCLAFTYHQGVKWSAFLRDFADSLIALWILYAMSYLIMKISKNVYLALILTELYGIIFGLMRVGPSMIWNV